MYHYLKHAFLIALMPVFASLLVLAPNWAFLGPLYLCLHHMLLDMGTPRDRTIPSFRFPAILDAYLYLHLVVSSFCLGLLLWVAAPGDLWGIGHWLDGRFGLGIVGRNDHSTWVGLLSAALTAGFLVSTNTLVGHELTHRTTDRFAMFTGRWLLALVGDAQFSISHVYGHHVNVGTSKDPATARRGENLYEFALRSTLGQYREAWELENRRLQGRSWLVRLLANKVISGLAMTGAVAVCFYAFAGTRGLAAYALVLVMTKFLFEAVNYIEHYGLVRVPGTPIEPRHSWDCSTRAASNILLNLPRHAHHHANARVKYWALTPMEGALDLPYGYLGHITLAMVPPLWHRFAAPRLAHWDDTMAKPAERELAAQANRLSKHHLFPGSDLHAMAERRQIEEQTMLERYATWIVRHRRLIVVLMLLATGLFVSQIKNLKIIVDPNTMLPQQHPYVVGTNMAERVFGTNYTLVVAVAPKRGDIYRPEILERVQQISEGLAALPAVKKETLMSLSARRAKEIRGNKDGLEVRPFMERVPQTHAELNHLKRAIETNPIYQNAIVARDGSAAAITVSVEKGAKGFRPVMEEVYKLIEPLKTADIDIAVSGSPMFINWVEVFAQRMGPLFLISLIVVGLLHFEAFRTMQGLFLPLVTAILSVFWGLGLMGIAKVPMDAFNAVTPILILAITAGHAVQLLKRYYEEYELLSRKGMDLKQANSQAVVASIVRVGPVMLAAGGVAAAAFFSLMTFSVDTIRTFGVFTGLGILSGLLIEMTFIPALRAWLKPPKIREAKDALEPKVRIWDRIANHITSATTGSSRVPIYVAAIAIAAVGAMGIRSLSLENSYKSYFAADLPFQRDDRLINQRMGGTNTLYVVFEGERDEAIKDPAVLRFIDDTQRFLEQQKGVGKTVSIADLVKRMNQAMSGDDPKAFVVPNNTNLISQYLLLYSMSGEPSDFDLYVDYQYRRASLTAFLKSDSSLYIQDLIAKLSSFMQSRQVSGVKVHFGGSVPQASALSEVLVEGKLKNMAQMGLVVFLVAALVFRSLVAGLLVMAPLAITVFINFGVMGLMGIPLNTSSAVACALAIGLGADYAIYLLYRIKEEFTVHGDLANAVKAAINTAGKAVLFVGSAIASGYAVLLFSSGFYIHIWSAVLTVTSTIVGVITSLYLVPALVVSLSARFVTVSRPAAKTGAISTVTGLLAIVAIFCHGDARAGAASAAEIMEQNFATSKFDDSVSEATFRLVHKNGDMRVRKTYGVTKLAPNGDDTKRMTRFLSPADIRNTVTVLVEHADRDDEIWIYLPALRKVRRLASSNKKDSFVGTDLSYGDVIGHKVRDWNHKLIREEEDAGGQRLYVIECTPKTSEVEQNSGYSRRVHWISSESFVAEKSEFYDLQGRLLKTATAKDIRKVDDKKGRWQPMHVEVRQHQTGHTTIIEFDRFSVNQGVDNEFFSTSYMEREK